MQSFNENLEKQEMKLSEKTQEEIEDEKYDRFIAKAGEMKKEKTRTPEELKALIRKYCDTGKKQN